MDTLRPSSGRGVSTDHAARSRAETCHIIGAAALSLRGSGSGCRSMAVASLAFRRPGGTALHPLMTRCGRLHLLFQGASCVGKAISALSDPFASVRHRPGATRVGPMSVVFRRPHRGLAIPMPPMAAAIRLGRGVPGQRAGRAAPPNPWRPPAGAGRRRAAPPTGACRCSRRARAAWSSGIRWMRRKTHRPPCRAAPPAARHGRPR